MLTPLQIDQRRNSIGGSDASVVADCNPYKTRRELYHEKRGELAPPDLSDNNAVHWGNVLEDTVASEYARRTGNNVRRVNRTLIHRDYACITAHIDRDILKTNRALECKTAGAFVRRDDWGPTGTDQVPEEYLIQCQHYMSVLPKVDVFDLAVLIGGRDFRIYEIPRDNTLIGNLIDIEVEFWDMVTAGEPPPIDHDHRSAIDLINKLYPGTDGSVITLPQDAVGWHETLINAKEQAKAYRGIIDSAKARLLGLCGSSSISLLPGKDGAGYTRKKLTKKPYTVVPKPYIDFRFSKKPKGVSR